MFTPNSSPRLNVYMRVKWASLRFPNRSGTSDTHSVLDKLFAADFSSFDPIVQQCLHKSEDYKEVDQALETQYRWGGPYE